MEVPIKSTSKKVSAAEAKLHEGVEFFFNGWIIHEESFLGGESINQLFCIGDQMCLREMMGGKCQENWGILDWCLLRDIVPAHTTLFVQPSLTENKVVVGNTLLPRPSPLWRLRVSKDDNPMQGTKIRGFAKDWGWNTGGTGETELPRD